MPPSKARPNMLQVQPPPPGASNDPLPSPSLPPSPHSPGAFGPGLIRPKYARVPTSPSTPSHQFPVSGRESIQLPSSSRSRAHSVNDSVSEKFALSPDPYAWGSNLLAGQAEPDDFLHNPGPKQRGGKAAHDSRGTIFTTRGLMNIGCLGTMVLGLIALFTAYPVVTYITKPKPKNFGAFNVGGINATGQVPSMGNFGLIDLDTPQAVHTKRSYVDGSQLQLVFSDEFNTDGRSFYPGDDPYWEAVDLHYWQTANLEWYDPSTITTKNGALEVSLLNQPNHNLSYMGGMMSTWNKFCFTGGLIETSVILPGVNNVAGLWPAVWTMGNLGRAGYGASLEGMWPYSYDACDVGTLANQTLGGLPEAGKTYLDPYTGREKPLSYLPGQRLSRCTCPGEPHPGPVHSDGTYVGRAAPEIDVFEAQAREPYGIVSQSAQWAPFDYQYAWHNTSDNQIINDDTVTERNIYMGGWFQETTSSTTRTDATAYELDGGNFAVYGFEYKPGYDDGYISWIANNKLAWTVKGNGLSANTMTEISARPIPQEPMYIIVNLGISFGFGSVDVDHLVFPSKMSVDYIRVYQRSDAINIGCDPEDYPTADYINAYPEAYTNPKLTTWKDDYKQPFPKNRLIDQC